MFQKWDQLCIRGATVGQYVRNNPLPPQLTVLTLPPSFCVSRPETPLKLLISTFYNHYEFVMEEKFRPIFIPLAVTFVEECYPNEHFFRFTLLEGRRRNVMRDENYKNKLPFITWWSKYLHSVSYPRYCPSLLCNQQWGIYIYGLKVEEGNRKNFPAKFLHTKKSNTKEGKPIGKLKVSNHSTGCTAFKPLS